MNEEGPPPLPSEDAVKEESHEIPPLDSLPLPPPIRKNRWGKSMLKEADEETEKKTRKRKSRWEAEDTSTAIVVSDGSKALVAVFPRSVRLTNGLQVGDLTQVHGGHAAPHVV